jgi:choline dehydrogenase
VKKLTDPEHFDYIIVGAGSAGCVLANRLSNDPRNSVLLIEASGDDRPWRNLRHAWDTMMIHVPVGFARTLATPALGWGYKSQPEPGTEGRIHELLRGKVLGGCSSINGMIYVRGQPEDYDHWRQLGATGWSSDDVLPYFLRSAARTPGAASGGPLNVTSAGSGGMDVSRAVMRACEQADIPIRKDLNGAEQEGVAWADLTVRNGRRHSTAVAYLHPILNRKNLKLLTGTLVDRILFKGKRAAGVRYVSGSHTGEVRARGELVLCGGTYNSSQLLELSGIGDGGRLRELGIETIVHQPQVGENLQDHVLSAMTFRLKPHVASVNELTRGLRLAREVVKYAGTRRGLLARGSVELLLFARSGPQVATPDIQMHIMPATKTSATGAQHMVAEIEPGLTFAPCHLRPESRGHSHIQSSDAAMQSDILDNYLTAVEDQTALLAGMSLVRAIAAQSALKDYIEYEKMPGTKCDSDAALMAFIRASATPMHHPVGTCRMGSDDAAGSIHSSGHGGSRDCVSSMGRSCPGSSRETPTHRSS